MNILIEKKNKKGIYLLQVYDKDKFQQKIVVEVVIEMMFVEDKFLFESLLVLYLFYNLLNVVDSNLMLIEKNLLVLIYKNN